MRISDWSSDVCSSDLAYHYPAIDVLTSLSRVMPRVTEPAHQRAAGQLRKYLAKYQDIELLLQLGEYKRGTDPDADIAIEKIGPMRKLLPQSADELLPFEQSAAALRKLLPGGAGIGGSGFGIRRGKRPCRSPPAFPNPQSRKARNSTRLHSRP